LKLITQPCKKKSQPYARPSAWQRQR